MRKLMATLVLLTLATADASAFWYPGKFIRERRAARVQGAGICGNQSAQGRFGATFAELPAADLAGGSADTPIVQYEVWQPLTLSSGPVCVGPNCPIPAGSVVVTTHKFTP